jgi:sugar transferase EpsL
VTKRLFDVFAAALGLALTSPIMLVLAVLIRFKLGKPVLFRQLRPGLNGQPFELLKFRSMTDERDEAQQLLPDHARLTRFGRFLRSSSLDELPELWNVLKGEMSIVGPRPLLMEYLPLYSEQQRRRHEVRPGITGWAQVNGRNALSWSQKFELDIWYVENRSFALDLWICWLTILRLIRPSGINSPHSATAEKFTGNDA